MRDRDLDEIARRITDRLAETLGDYGTWYPKLVEAAKVGYPSGGGGGRSSEVSDPTFRAATGRDEMAEARRDHDRDMKDLISLIKKIEKRRLWVLVENRKSYDPLPVVCDTCGDHVSMEGHDVIRDGECNRCYRHRRRHGMAYPMVRVVGRSTA